VVGEARAAAQGWEVGAARAAAQGWEVGAARAAEVKVMGVEGKGERMEVKVELEEVEVVGNDWCLLDPIQSHLC
jgi:hypothetical protein